MFFVNVVKGDLITARQRIAVGGGLPAALSYLLPAPHIHTAGGTCHASDRILLIHNSRLSACAAACTAAKGCPGPRCGADPRPNRRRPGPPQPYRAVWVSYLEWEQVDFSSAEAFTQAIGTMLDNIQSIGATVVLVQVRPFGDALYPSDYFPFSHLCTGTQGLDPGFDPLALLVDAAHARGLQLEAWVNPYRIQAGQTPALCGASPARLHPDWVRYTDTGAYLDPANADVRQYIADGVGELCARYAVDGIHFDDYFYPTTDPGL